MMPFNRPFRGVSKPQNLDAMGMAPYTSAVPWMDVF
jgi:hypothetical protein